MKPRKSLSQNYLTDPNIARKIAESVTYADAARIIEVGPGYGMLTRFLFERFPEQLMLLEIDRDAVEKLKNIFPGLKDKIYHADILSFPLNEILVPGSVVTGNLPYHISSPIFFRILDFRRQIKEAVFMIQKEVAERIASSPGSKKYGLLSVLIQTFYHVEYLFSVSEKVFYPRPKVQSAVIRLLRNERKTLPCDEKLFQQVIRKIFGQRRKMLRNSLGGMAAVIMQHREFLQRRPEQMSVEDFILLCAELDSG